MALSWGSLPQELLIEVNHILDELKKYDIETYKHCLRVSQLCRFLAEKDQLSPYDILVSQFAGLLHDVGKMKVSRKILNKPERLTKEEYNKMKDHPVISAEMLEPLEGSSFFREVQLAVLHHHERMDGKGYPYGLQGDQIPYISRLILVVDTVDAMTQTRAYRKGLPFEVVYQELEKYAGTQFDSHLAQLFINAHKELEKSQTVGRVITLSKKIKAA